MKTGSKVSPETRQRMSEAKCGKRHPMWGKKHTVEAKAKMRIAHQGKKLSLEHRRKIGEARQGERNPRWNNGQTHHRHGYVLIRKPDHPFAPKPHGYMMEHRLVMEEYVGRFLNREEIVHHINGDPIDNRIENLMLFGSRKKHLDFHRGQI